MTTISSPAVSPAGELIAGSKVYLESECFSRGKAEASAEAIGRLATAYLKLLFPAINPTPDEFHACCVQPAVELRQRVRDELHKIGRGIRARVHRN